MRVIGGFAKGRKLKTLEGDATRPTLDRVKESVFNMALPWIHDGEVLDLFGGSGALGIEAVSRGAKSAVINDKSKDAVRIIKENVSMCKLDDKIEITSSDWETVVDDAQRKGRFYDIIFLDPPYNSKFFRECVDKCREILNNDGVIIVEHNDGVSFENGVIKEKKYGKVIITFIGKGNE